MPSTEFQVAGVEDLRRLSRDLRRAGNGKELAKRLRKELRAEAKPMVPAIRRNIRRMPSKGENRRRGRKSLRAEMARSVTLQIRTSGKQAGISIFMDPKKMPSGKKGLPGYFERVPGKTQLRHPTFGHDPRVNQSVPAAGYFTRTTRDMEEGVQRGVRRVMNEITIEIEDG